MDGVVEEGEGFEAAAHDGVQHGAVEDGGVVADAACKLVQGAALDVVHDDAVAHAVVAAVAAGGAAAAVADEVVVAVVVGAWVLDKVVAVGDNGRVEVRDGHQLQQIHLPPRKVVVLLQNLHAAELIALQVPRKHTLA